MTKEDRAHNLLIYMVMINSRKYPQAYGPVSKGEDLNPLYTRLYFHPFALKP
jgi:hypothetical protein